MHPASSHCSTVISRTEKERGGERIKEERRGEESREKKRKEEKRRGEGRRECERRGRCWGWIGEIGKWCSIFCQGIS